MKYGVILAAASVTLARAQQVAQPIVQQPGYAYNQQGMAQQQMKPDADSPMIPRQDPSFQQQQPPPPQYVHNAIPQMVQGEAVRSITPQQQQPVMQQAVRPPAPNVGHQQAQPAPNAQQQQQVPNPGEVPVLQVGGVQYNQHLVPQVQYQAPNSQIYAAQQAAAQPAGVVQQQPPVIQNAQKPAQHPVMIQPGQGPVKIAAPYNVGQPQPIQMNNDQAILAQQMAAAAARQQQALYGNVAPVVGQQQPIYVNPGVSVQQQAGGAMQYDHPYANIYNNAPKVVGVKPANAAPPTMVNVVPQVASESTETDTGSSIAADWDKHMQNFMPQMILTFKLNGGEAEHFHQDVTIPGTLIRGGYFESTTEGAQGSGVSVGKTGGRRHVGFKILSPSGKLLFSSDKAESLFRVDCEEVGTYTFAVSSASWSKSKFVTFVMGTGEVSPLSGSDISSIDGNIKMLYRMLSEIETHNNLLWTRHRAQAEQIRKTSNKTYYAFIIELLCTAAAIIAQLATVKKMISKRSMF